MRSEIEKFSCSINETIANVVEKISENKIQHCFIISTSNKLLGVISEGDLIKNLAPGNSGKSSVAEVMNLNPITIANNSFNKRKVFELMKKSRVNCVAIVSKNGEFEGVISIWDVLE